MNQKFGCHCALEPGQLPDYCVIDRGAHHLCVYAEKGMKKEDCKYWLPCEEVEESSEARMKSHIEEAMKLMRESGADEREYVVYSVLHAALNP